MLLLAFVVVVLANFANSQQLTEPEMIDRLQIYDQETRTYCNQQVHANWNVQTDVGNVTNEEEQVRVTVAYATYRKQQYDLYFRDAEVGSYESDDVKRQLTILKNIGTAALSEEDLSSLTRTRQNMSEIYNSARICPYNMPNCDLATQGWTLDPEIEQRLASLAATGGSYQEMQYIWEEWHEHSGKHMREQYKNYVELNNKAALENGFADAGVMWRDRYEYSNLVDLVDNLWREVEPLYNELHRYVRYQLSDIHGNDLNKADPLLPAHVFGNMWAQNWGHLYELTRPFKNASDVDVTAKMEEQAFTEHQMYVMSDQFYMSLGLPTSSMSYNPPAIIVKPEDKTIACHASAWDFCDVQRYIRCNLPYIRYFVSHILQFQFHRSVCQAARQYVPNDPSKPLHKCDIQGNAVAGSIIKAGLSSGLSKHWTEALNSMTNESEMSGKALHECFAPLYEWLKQANSSSTMNRVSVFLLTIVVAVYALI